MEFILAIGANVFPESILKVYGHPLVTKHALYLSMVSSALYLMVDSHLYPTKHFPLGKLEIYQIWFLFSAFISLFIARFHLGSGRASSTFFKIEFVANWFVKAFYLLFILS